MKDVFCMTLLLVCMCNAGATEICYYRPDGERDWSMPCYQKEDDGTVVTIRPDGQRDWSAPTYKVEDGEVVTYRPDGQRDWSAPVQKAR